MNTPTPHPEQPDQSADSGGLVPAPTNPMAVARHLAPQWQHDGDWTLRHWRGTWMAWDRSYWRELDDGQIRARLYRDLEHATYTHQLPNGTEEERDWAPTIRKVADLMQATAAVSHLDPTTDAPAWISPDHDADAPAGPIVACRNGLLRVADRALLPLSPRFFNLVSVPFAYDPDATAPAWEAFLRKLWPDDPAPAATLQEWFGYVLSGRTDQQKILLIIGPTRSGKGTIARILAALVGAGNVAGPTLASLGTNFGLSTLVGKPFAIISDARLSGREGGPVVERLLTISGEDTIDVDRKYRQPWTGKLPTRLMILSNELPQFGDSSGVIAQRFVVLNMALSWLGQEDTTLTDRLAREMPGILNWALDGLARLEQSGRLTVPDSSRETVLAMQDIASPTSAFVRERCRTGPACRVPVDALWAAWKDWAEDNGVKTTGTKQLFGRNLLSVVPQLRRSKPRGADGRQVPTYLGITLADSTPLCDVCGQPYEVLTPGQRTHPTCGPGR
ncbi:phage/plasmid primase, P4 family [Streptomyces sp. NPDC058426]|uniref:DNA primase family protein n=1 Tax=Streptomyces sp. NPDC058426 TaxID=3346493 RepID=UPI003656A25C